MYAIKKFSGVRPRTKTYAYTFCPAYGHGQLCFGRIKDGTLMLHLILASNAPLFIVDGMHKTQSSACFDMSMTLCKFLSCQSSYKGTSSPSTVLLLASERNNLHSVRNTLAFLSNKTGDTLTASNASRCVGCQCTFLFTLGTDTLTARLAIQPTSHLPDFLKNLPARSLARPLFFILIGSSPNLVCMLTLQSFATCLVDPQNRHFPLSWYNFDWSTAGFDFSESMNSPNLLFFGFCRSACLPLLSSRGLFPLTFCTPPLRGGDLEPLAPESQQEKTPRRQQGEAGRPAEAKEQQVRGVHRLAENKPRCRPVKIVPRKRQMSVLWVY